MNSPAKGPQVSVSKLKRSLRLRASAEAFDVLRESGSPKISNAELLKHSVRSDSEPHPRIVREVYQALRDARDAMPKEAPSALQRISGIFSRKQEPTRASIEDVVRRFEQAFIQPD
jgi:hypothetical protein